MSCNWGGQKAPKRHQLMGFCLCLQSCFGTVERNPLASLHGLQQFQMFFSTEAFLFVSAGLAHVMYGCSCCVPRVRCKIAMEGSKVYNTIQF